MPVHSIPGLKISTHALTEGDAVGRPRKRMESLFQLTPSRRATISTLIIPRKAEFQLTPSRRATSAVQELIDSPIFQLTPSRRATSWS